MKQRYYLVKLYRGLGIKKITESQYNELVACKYSLLVHDTPCEDVLLQNDHFWRVARYLCRYGYFLLVRHLS